jgi:hypothetical protein
MTLFTGLRPDHGKESAELMLDATDDMLVDVGRSTPDLEEDVAVVGHLRSVTELLPRDRDEILGPLIRGDAERVIARSTETDGHRQPVSPVAVLEAELAWFRGPLRLV